MLRSVRFVVLALLAAGALSGGPGQAENEGREDLDRATEAKLEASTLSDLSKVIELCQSALKKGLDEENARFAKQLLASTHFQRGENVSKTIFAASPPDPRWPQFRRLALTDLEKAVELDPKQPEAFFLIAQLNLLPDGDAKRAAEALDQSIALKFDDPRLRAKALALRAGLRKDAKKKLADLDEAVRIAPNSPVALRTRGLEYAKQGKPEKALADFQKAVKLDPDHAPTYEAQAMVLATLKKYDEALVSLDQAQQLDPNSIAPLMRRAQVHSLQSNFAAALHDLDQAVTMKPDNVVVLILRAEVHHELGQLDKALADADKALELKPQLKPARRLRVMLLADAGKLGAAVDDLEELLEDDPDDVTLRLQLAMFHHAQKKTKKAVELFSAILADDPKNGHALRGRADSLLGIGKHAEAIADYEKALKLCSEESGIYNNLAWVLATSPDDKLRNGRRAVKLATKACELTKYKKAHILSTLAAAYAETGGMNDAVKWAEKAVELGGPDKKEALTKELESYRAGKPWRELLSDEKQEDKKAEKKKERRKGIDPPPGGAQRPTFRHE